MEKFFETHNNFRKLQLDTLPRHHPASGPSGLAGSRNATPPCNTPTPPIAVPPQLLRSSPVNSLQDSEDLSSLSSSGRYLESNYTVSPIELAARTKRSSIQFDPSAKLDAPGKHSKLQQHQNPVPRATPKIFSDDDSNFFEKKKVPSRTQSEASRFHYDSITGQLKGVGAVRNGPIEGKEQEGFGLGKITEGTKLQDGPPRRFLQANPSDVMMDEHGRMASLTSDSTASPPTEEYLHTPPMNQALGFGGHPFSHISRTHSYQDPISLHETSAWPRKLNSSQRNRSYNFEQPTRRSRRTSTASAGSAGSSGISPANQVRSTQYYMPWHC